MALHSSFNTPRSNMCTPRRLVNKNQPNIPPETPDCFSSVTVETPVANKRLSNRSKCDEGNNLRVAVRIRPMNGRELSCMGVTDVVRVKKQELVIRSNQGFDHIFQYDHVFWSCDESSLRYASQEDVFTAIGKPLLNSAFCGYNGCLFAYGQTGSGKSYSMMGSSIEDNTYIDADVNAGVIPRFCEELFSRISQLDETCTASVEVSYFEIYNEKIHDLLAVNVTNQQRTPLKVREHPDWGPYVVDLSTHSVKSYKELRYWLLMGNKNRATAATAMNEKSSRSHSIFSIELCLAEGTADSDSNRRSKVSLVDLAGSERLGNTSNEEKIRQGVSINKSLLTLGKVISSLAEQKKCNQYVPYRDSVLTWLLRESLGGNSLTSMLATITPASTHIDETLATLRYACQARCIVNRAYVNEDPNDKLIRELRAEVERLRALRQDYERNSFTPIIQIDDSTEHMQELEDLKQKLFDTENRLSEAQKSWEKRFRETKRKQLQELAKVEKAKEELESLTRVMSNVDVNVNLTPYHTNFLEELEDVLTISNSKQDLFNAMENIKNWCQVSNLNYQFSVDISGSFIEIVDIAGTRKAVILDKNIKNLDWIYPQDIIARLRWTNIEKRRVKKLSKEDVSESMNQMYAVLDSLKPATENDENLSLAFARISKSVQVFENILNNYVNKSNGTQKSVTFRV